MSTSNRPTVPSIFRVKDQRQEQLWYQSGTVAPPEKGVTEFIQSCSNCMKDGSAAVPMQKCSRCKMAWYCSKACQREHWQKHKANCEDVEAPAISRLVRKFVSNSSLTVYLRMCLVFHFDLLHNSDPNKPFMARIDVGIEPSDVAVCYQLLAGAEITAEIEGMLQLNALTTCDLLEATNPLTPGRLEMWHSLRETANSGGGLSDAVGLVDFVNDSRYSVITPVHIPREFVIQLGRSAEPFKFQPVLGPIREVPMSAMSCLEVANSRIRSDSKNVFRLRVPMRTSDKDVILGAGRGEDGYPVRLFTLKMAREGAYRVLINPRNMHV